MADEIIKIVTDYGLKVPFKRPAHLATDKANSYNVILHAIKHYESKGVNFDCVVLLQPTSPFRKLIHIKEAINMFNHSIDMVVAVKETKSNPYYLLHEENSNGYLVKSKENGNIDRRQDTPKVYEINGAVYIINTLSLKKKQFIDKFFKNNKICNGRHVLC